MLIDVDKLTSSLWPSREADSLYSDIQQTLYGLKYGQEEVEGTQNGKEKMLASEEVPKVRVSDVDNWLSAVTACGELITCTVRDWGAP